MQRLLRVLLPLLAVASAVACDAGSDLPDPTADGGPHPSGEGGRPGAVAEGSLASYPLRLVNPRPYVVIVLASAGATEVLVDTIPAIDSTRVDVIVESDLLRLRAVDLEGNELGSGYLSVADSVEDGEPPDSIPRLRWELPPPP